MFFLLLEIISFLAQWNFFPAGTHLSLFNIFNISKINSEVRGGRSPRIKRLSEYIGQSYFEYLAALDVQGDDYITPVRWNDWLKLPVREHDNSVKTPRGPVRVPTVIVAANYAKVPMRRPRFGARGIWERDGGVCQYTGRKLAPKEGNIDHVVPRCRGC
jgi:hypothetical protein